MSCQGDSSLHSGPRGPQVVDGNGRFESDSPHGSRSVRKYERRSRRPARDRFGRGWNRWEGTRDEPLRAAPIFARSVRPAEIVHLSTATSRPRRTCSQCHA
jgi:hypothetical protein